MNVSGGLCETDSQIKPEREGDTERERERPSALASPLTDGYFDDYALNV